MNALTSQSSSFFCTKMTVQHIWSHLQGIRLFTGHYKKEGQYHHDRVTHLLNSHIY